MNNAVIYFTRTGHSKKLARAIGEALDVNIEDIGDSPKLKDVDHLFIVSGVYSGKSSPKMLKYLETIEPAQVKNAALVISQGTKTKGREDVRLILERKGIRVIKEEYRCIGEFLKVNEGHPTKQEISGAAEFAKRIAGVK